MIAELAEVGRLRVHSVANSDAFDIGKLSFCVDGVRVHTVCWCGVEVLRGISAPIRDSNWGTHAESDLQSEVLESPDRVEIRQRYTVSGVPSQCVLSIVASSSGVLQIDWSFTPEFDLQVNRAGLCLLHPLKGVEGTDLQVTDPEGTISTASFPKLIVPSQPAKNIASMHHSVAGVSVDIALAGEIFEMEDQRNWSDASYKTYCRPLANPFPYSIRAGTETRQNMRMKVSGAPEPETANRSKIQTVDMPEILLAANRDWIAGTTLSGVAYLARFGDDEWDAEDLAALNSAPVDAEFIVPDGAVATEFLGLWAQRLNKAEISPRNVVALPEKYLKSYQPDGPWPEGLQPDECAKAARDTFPEARIGVGMLTNFTELNRHRPDPGLGDYITHSNAAIVHAADDRSVLQTLEAWPSILNSSRKLAGQRGYRLGLCAIAMRSNPYGEGLSENPDGGVMTMTDTDPRQGTDFAAAYAIALTAQAAAAGVEAICLGAEAGPFALDGPLETAVAHLSAMANAQVNITVDGARCMIGNEALTLIANGSAYEWKDALGGSLSPATWRVIPDGAGS